MATEVTKEDLNRIYDAIGPMQQDIAEIKTTLKLLPQPPKQPCQWQEQLRKEFDGHIIAHNVNVRDWKGAFIKASVDIIKLAIVAGLGLVIGMMMK